MTFVIYGTGGFGRELVRTAQEMLGGSDLAFADEKPSGHIMGLPVLSPDVLTRDDQVVIAVANSRIRQQIAEGLKASEGTLISPTALIGRDVEIGPGAVICDLSIVTASAVIGRQFHSNIYSYVAHDCVIGDYVTFAPRVCCNGNVHIKDHAYIGTGAVLKQGTADKPLVIGEGAIVGMGAVVTKDVPPGTTVIGNPARPLERRTGP